MAEFDSVIPAGSSGTLKARLVTASTQRGRVSKSIAVFTDAPGAPDLRLRFSVELYMPVVATPAPRLAINVVEGNPGSATLLLSRDDGLPLTVAPAAALQTPGLTVLTEPGGASTPDPPAVTRARPRTRATGADGGVRLELRSSAAVPPGTYTGSLRLTTNHPEADRIELPYTVRVRPLLEPRPDVVRLWATAPSNDPGRSVLLTISHNGGRSFTVAGVEVSHPDLFSAAATPGAPSSRQLVRVRLAEELESDRVGGGVRGWVRITTDDAEHPGVEVPVLVARSRLASRRPVHAPRDADPPADSP